MSSVVLKKISQPQQITEVDLYSRPTPVSYMEWVRNNIGIVPEDTQTQYTQYLTTFYRGKQISSTTAANKIKEDYLNLVKRLAVVFKNDAEFERFSKIDFSSPTELKLAIPYFSKKLKEIAVYYASVRESIKKTKLHYATIGSEMGIERHLYSKLLEAFAVNMPLNSPAVLSPTSIEDVKDELRIEVEELYEDANYFDSANLDINPLFCVLDNLIFNVCQNEDIFALTTSTDPLRRQYICEADQVSPNQLLAEGWQNYASNDLYYVTGGDLVPNMIDVRLPFKIDNNFFYWFSGEAVHEIPDGIYNTIGIAELNWNDATPGQTIDSSDIIFTSYGNLKTEGAWFMSADKISFLSEMTATMFDGKEFKFPYPGHGLSAESGVWGGRSITDLEEDDKRFFPNELSFQENRQAITRLYWSDAPMISSTDSVFIQDLTLWQSGAYPSTSFKQADKLIIRTNTGTDGLHDTTPNEVYWGNLDTAWLYDFKKTQIPIISETNNVYFPLTSFTSSEDLYFRYESGTDIALSSVKVNGAFTGAVAGSDIADSDFLVKKRTVCGPELEGAWLAGTPLSSLRGGDPLNCVCDDNEFITSTDWFFAKGVTQPGISFKVSPNESVKFVWSGPDTKVSNVRGFNGFIHDDACPYKQLNHTKSIMAVDFLTFNQEDVEKWKKCSCRAVYHSPLGQKTDVSELFKFTPDLILRDTDPESVFNTSEWRGTDGQPFNTSNDATRFRLDDRVVDKDVGWGSGEWVNDIVLETGKTYIYYRSNLNRCDIAVPEFIINECYANIVTPCDNASNIPVWKKAVKDLSGKWVKTDVVSDMTLDSGVFYEYTHRKSSVWEKQKIQIDGQDVVDPTGFVTINRTRDNYSFRQAVNDTPSVEFLIKVDLADNTPYWGAASYDSNTGTKFKNLHRNYDDGRLVGTHLICNQPFPSTVILGDSSVIRYESFACNDCFIWKQPITVNVNVPVRQWNKILLDDCVKSEILTYLHGNCGDSCVDYSSPCGCGEICASVKAGVTATNIPSDMSFNVEMSGVPLFVNYFARNPFTLNLQVEDILNPLRTEVVSGVLVEASAPWRNLINDEYASFVSTQVSDNLQSVYDLGMFVPQKLALGKYELHDADATRVYNDKSTFRSDNYFDGPYTPTNINSEWMKKSNGEPLVNGHQTYYPYEASQSRLGLYDREYPISPWEASTIPENYRGQTLVNCGPGNMYTTLQNITGNVVQWQTDVYGNQFFLVNDYHTKYDNMGAGNVFLKVGGDIFGISSLSAILSKYGEVDVVDGQYLMTNDGQLLATEDGYVIVVN